MKKKILIREKSDLLENIYNISFFLMIISFELGYLTYCESLIGIFALIRKVVFGISAVLFGLLLVDKFFSIIKEFYIKDLLIYVYVLVLLLLVVLKLPLTHILIILATYFYRLSNYKNILKSSFLAVTIWFVLWFSLFSLGQLGQNYYGFTYKNDGGLFVFFLGIVFSFALSEKHKILVILPIVFTSIFDYFVFHCRTPLFCAVAFVVVYCVFCLYVKLDLVNRYKVLDNTLKYLFSFIPIVLFLISVLIYFLTKNQAIIDGAFMARFVELKTYWNTYDIKLIGNTIHYCRQFNGAYIYGDNLFFRYVFEYGVVISIIAVLIIYFLNKKLYSSYNPFIIAIISGISVYYIMEVNCYYFAFIPVCLAYKDYLKKSI